MRKLVAALLIAMMASLGIPSTASAASPTSPQLSAISGASVDAGGRAVVNQRVELLRETELIQSTMTGSRGEWRFTNVTPGDYIVRMTINGKVSGMRVSVAAGQPVAQAMIVAPSAAVPDAAFLAALGFLWGSLATGAIIVGAAAAVIAVKGS